MPVDERVLIPMSDLPAEVFERLRSSFSKVPPLGLIEALEVIRLELDGWANKTGRGVTVPDQVIKHVLWMATAALVQNRVRGEGALGAAGDGPGMH